LFLIEGEPCGQPEYKGVHRDDPKSKTEPGESLEILFQQDVSPVPECFDINLFYE
jgi:hypothetical protein